MTGLLADINAEGQLTVLLRILESKLLRDEWREINVQTQTFASLGLSRTISDIDLWRICQGRSLILITANRNDEGPDSLEAAIRTLNTPSSLPVMTLANPNRVVRDRPYAQITARRLLEYIANVEQYRGTGRLYLP